MKDSKNYVIAALCLVLCIMAVGYAAFSTSLTVNGTAETGSTWNVAITDASCTKTPASGGSEADITATPTVTGGNVVSVAFAFTQPGDSATCTITVTNSGSIKAILSSYSTKIGDTGGTLQETDITTTAAQLTANANEPILITATGLAVNDKLPANTGNTATLTVGAQYQSDLQTTPTSGYSRSVQIVLGYAQDFS